jgi:hypothetical protein
VPNHVLPPASKMRPKAIKIIVDSVTYQAFEAILALIQASIQSIF